MVILITRAVEATGATQIPLDGSIFDLPVFAQIRDDFLKVGQPEKECTVGERDAALEMVVAFTFAKRTVGADNVFRPSLSALAEALMPCRIGAGRPFLRNERESTRSSAP